MAARDAEFTTSRTSNDELKAIVATLEQSVADADAKASRLEAAAAAAAASRDQMESLRQEMLADKDEALKMLEDNFEEEMARKDEENERNWKSFAASSVEEQSAKLKGEAEAREARLTDELKETRERAAAAAAEAAATLAAAMERSVAREQQLQSEAAATIKELERARFFESLDFEKVYRKEYTPIYKPNLGSDTDVANFDPQFTNEVPMDSVVDSSALAGKANQFEGFTYQDASHLS